MRFIFIILNFILLFAYTHIQAQTNELKLGLVLSGGGAKGFAHIGVLKVFEQEGIPITLIAGNSIGTIVGALYSAGYTAQEIEDFAKGQDWEMLLSDGVPRKLKSPFKQDYEQKYLLQLLLNKESNSLTLPSGLVYGHNILNVFCGLTASISDSINFNDLPIPFACIAYDLTTGKEVVINQGYLPKAMLSSMSIPGVFSPVDYDGMNLIDGGIINNFPVDVAKEMGADIVIGVDLQQENTDSADIESIVQVFSSIVDKIEMEKHDNNIKLADVVINPVLTGISTFSFYAEAIDSIIKMGEIAAREQLPAIRRIIENKNIKANNNHIKYANQDQWLISKLILPEKYKEERKFILKRLDLAMDKEYTMEEIKQATTRIFAYGNFKKVYFKLHPNSKGYSLELFIDDKRESKAMFGAGLNTTDVTALYFNYSHQNYSNIISLMTFDVKLAVNPQAKLKLETHNLFFSTVGFELAGRFNKLEYFENDNKLAKLDIGSTYAGIYSYRRFFNVVDMGSGLRQSYFNSGMYSNDPLYADDADAEEFFTSLYGFLAIDTRDNSYMPNSGLYLNSTVTVLLDSSDFSNIIPIYSLKINSINKLSKNFSLAANLYHRSFYNTEVYKPYYANYSSNIYNSFTDFYFPLLGQRGVGFLQTVSTLVEVGLRIKIGKEHYFTPKVQALSQSDSWDNINSGSLTWCSGVSYQTITIIGPVDITFGFRDNFKTFSFYGGLGFQF